jgi:Fe(3+) dicitrate transport protein
VTAAIGTLTRGIELAADVPLLTTDRLILRASTATSYFDARYTEGTIVSAGNNIDIEGNRAEAVPKVITRNGLHLAAGRLTASAQVSHVTDSYADALNTDIPSVTGAIGKCPRTPSWI